MSGKRIVFCTFGSLGDIHPYLALARELKRGGDSPVIATMPSYRGLIEREGIEFQPVRPDIDVSDPAILAKVMDRRRGGHYLIGDLILPALRDTYEDTARIAADADLLVTHPMTLAAFLYARKTGMPWASTALAPVSMYSTHDPPVLAGIPFAGWLAGRGPSFQKHFLKTMAALFETLWKPSRQFEKELGLGPAPNPLFWGHSPRLALALFSPLLASRQTDWPENAHATGFPYFAHGNGNPEELEQFLGSDDPPIVFTLGSAAVGVAGDFFDKSAETAHRLGRRAVLLIGRDPRNKPKSKLPAGVIAVEYAPHSDIFPRACVVVHQGGIGTTGEAMRAGRPMLVVPYGHDQPDHAARLTRIGIARTISRERYNAEVAVREIRTLLSDPGYAQRADALASAIARERGIVTACDLLRGLISKHEPREKPLTTARPETGLPRDRRFLSKDQPVK